MIIPRYFLTMAAALALGVQGTASAQQADNEIVYCLGDHELDYGTGGKNAETYDVALRLIDPALVGLQVKAVRISFAQTDQLSNAHAWLTRELPAIKSSKAGEPDICKQAFDISTDDVEVVFDEPYTITAEGVYVGYSFDVAKVTGEAVRPVKTTQYTSPDGFYIHTTKVYRTAWRSLYPNAGQLAMQVELAGDQVMHNAASAAWAPEVNLRTGQSWWDEFELVNHGNKGIRNVEYTLEIDGQSFTNKEDVYVKSVYGRYATVPFELPAMSEKGAYPYTITITKVNGEANEDAYPSVSGVCNVYNTLPKHRSVVEEYTGTWCGYCPRGFVGLEEMKRRHPDDFIGISYHAGHPSMDFSTYDYEPLQFTTDFPNTVDHYPTSWLDRMFETDPFCGVSTYRTFGIEELWLERCKAFAPAWVDLAVTLSDDQKVITAESTLNFVINLSDHPYRLSYLLVADSLYDESWLQNNAYTADAGWPECMDEYVAGGQMMHVVHRDICIARSSRDGLEGSLPADIKAFEPVSHTWQIRLDDVVNSSGEPIVQDASKLHVVVLLIDSTTNEIVNARQAHPGESTGIARLEHRLADAPVSFDLLGRRVGQSARGLRFTRSADGKVRKYLSAPGYNR